MEVPIIPIVLTLALVFHVFRATEQVFDSLKGPIFSWPSDRDRSHRESPPIKLNKNIDILRLYAAYQFPIMLIGVMAGQVGHEYFRLSVEEGLYWGAFIAAILVTLTRLCAVFVTTRLVLYLHITVILCVTIFLHVFLRDIPAIVKDPMNARYNLFIDGVLKPEMHVPFVFLAVFLAVTSILVMEVLIVYLPHRGCKRTLIPLALIRERREEFMSATQTFWPPHIAQSTRSLIGDRMRSSGMTKFDWITNTGPVDHVQAAIDAHAHFLSTTERGISEEDGMRIAVDLIKQRSRIIVCQHGDNSGDDDKIRDLKSLVANVRVLRGHTLRNRLMLINENTAIVHQPVPFLGTPWENSNVAMMIEDPEVLPALMDYFESQWRRLPADVINAENDTA